MLAGNFCGITVEPVLFIFMFATYMEYVIFQDLMYQKVCMSSFNETVCMHLHNEEFIESLDIVQHDASMWILYSSIALVIPSIVTTNILGSWGDNFGRRIPLLAPSFGGILSCAVYIFMSHDLSGPVWPILIASISSGLSGGFVSCTMAVMSYISNISSEESRTARVIILESMTFLGGTFGPCVAAGLLSLSTHIAVFAVIASCHVVLILFVLFCVPQVMTDNENTSNNRCCSSLQFRETWNTCFRQRDGIKRAAIICCIVCIVVIMTTFVGKPEGKRPVGRPRMRWQNNIKYDLREVDYTGNDWKALAQDRDVWRAYVRAAMNLRVR